MEASAMKVMRDAHPHKPYVPIKYRFAYIRFEGKGDQDKALQLDGTDVRGWTAIVKPAVRPLQSSFSSCARIDEEFKLFVSGYDTCPPEIDIKIALRNHFFSCGVVTDISLLPSGRAIITIGGKGCVEKALELSGRQVGEMNLLVNTGKKTTEIRKSRRLINDNACGYVLGTYSREVAKRRKEEIAKDKKKGREMKMKEKEKKKEKKEKDEKEKKGSLLGEDEGDDGKEEGEGDEKEKKGSLLGEDEGDDGKEEGEGDEGEGKGDGEGLTNLKLNRLDSTCL